MLVDVLLIQSNKVGKVSFSAKATFNTGSDLSLDSIVKNVSKFCVATNKLAAKTRKLGYKGFNNFRKSQPLTLILTGEDINTITLEFGNFGKFLDETTEKNLTVLMSALVDHVETYVNFQPQK